MTYECFSQISDNQRLVADLSSYLALTGRWVKKSNKKLPGYIQFLENETTYILSSPIGRRTTTTHNEWISPREDPHAMSVYWALKSL